MSETTTTAAGRMMKMPSHRISIRLEGDQGSKVRFERFPGLTSQVHLTGAVRAARSPGPRTRLQALLLSRLTEAQIDAIGVMMHDGAVFAPDLVIPEQIDSESSSEPTERIRDARPEALVRALRPMYGSDLPDRWCRVVDTPHRWLADVAGAHRAIAPVIHEIWTRAQPRISFEQYRFDVAMAGGGAFPSFVNACYPFELSDDCVSMPFVEDLDFSITIPLVLSPIAATADQSLMFGRKDMLSIAYAPGRPGRPVTERESAPLAILLGPARSSVLLRLSRPVTMGELARDLHYAPSTLTHHVAVLERSGLVSTSRTGSDVTVSRTPTGEILLDMLA